MASTGSNAVDIFEIYRRYCDIRSGKAYKKERNEQDDDIERVQFSRDALSQLLKFVELKVHTRISIVDELAKLMSRLEFMVDFSEFSCFYDFVFFMCRENDQKNITVSKAVIAWRLVLAGRFRLLNQWCDFVQENQRHNISEDTWQQVLAFSRCVHENLEGYDPEGAWPVLIDDFVEHMYRQKRNQHDKLIPKELLISFVQRTPSEFHVGYQDPTKIDFLCDCGDSESQPSIFVDPLPGLKVTPGLRRKLPSRQNEGIESSDYHFPEYADLNRLSNSKRNRLICHRPLNWEDNLPGMGSCY